LFSSHLPQFGLEATRTQLERVHDLWSLRQPRAEAAHRVQAPASVTPAKTAIAPKDWERALGRVVIGQQPSSELEREFARDPGTRLVASMIEEFRGSMVVGVYRLTSRLLMLALGPDIFRALLEEFWKAAPPRQFAGSEADAFADWLLARGLHLPQFEAVLAFERATVQTLRDGRPRVVSFSFAPLPLLRALADAVLPDNPGEPGEYEIEVRQDGPIRVGHAHAPAVSQTFPFH